MPVELRPLEIGDLPIIFENQRDPEAQFRVAFRTRNPDDRAAFDALWIRLWNDPQIINRAILSDGSLAGFVATFLREDVREVCYWLGRDYWGRGICSAALKQFLTLFDWRPLTGRVAADNIASIRVLEKCGFKRVEIIRSFAEVRGMEIDEAIYQLE